MTQVDFYDIHTKTPGKAQGKKTKFQVLKDYLLFNLLKPKKTA